MRGEKTKFKKLYEIYDTIPELKCVSGCNECCGVIFWFRIEEENIRRYLKEHNIEYRYAKSLSDKCPYFEDGRCVIYPVRPVICRLYGVVENLRCKYVAAKHYLKKKAAHQIIKEIEKM